MALNGYRFRLKSAWHRRKFQVKTTWLLEFWMPGLSWCTSPAFGLYFWQLLRMRLGVPCRASLKEAKWRKMFRNIAWTDDICQWTRLMKTIRLCRLFFCQYFHIFSMVDIWFKDWVPRFATSYSGSIPNCFHGSFHRIINNMSRFECNIVTFLQPASTEQL